MKRGYATEGTWETQPPTQRVANPLSTVVGGGGQRKPAVAIGVAAECHDGKSRL